MTNTWAAKVLEGVVRLDTDPNDYSSLIPTKDGSLVSYDNALAAIARMGAGDGLVERWDAYVESMGSVMGEVEHMAQQMRDHIAALKAERDIHAKKGQEWAEIAHAATDRGMRAEAERNKLEIDLATVLAREAKTFIRHDAKVARLEGALKGLVEHCEVTRDTAGFWKSRQTHQVSPTQWQSWCKQIKTARDTLTDGDKHA